MTPAKIAVTEADIARAIKGAIAGGMTPGEVRVTPSGTIRVFAARSVTPDVQHSAPPWCETWSKTPPYVVRSE